MALNKPYSLGAYNKFDDKEQWIRITEGCPHHHEYCLSGNTTILMSDLTTKQLKDIVIGDKIIGINKVPDKKSNSLKFCDAIVLNKFCSPNKLAYKITLENSIELFCSGDHRWLTNRGWKYTHGTMGKGIEQRPFLTQKNEIRGIGDIAKTPILTKDYKWGYLTGMILGDGLLKIYSDKRYPKSINCKQYQFRLVLKDIDGIERTKNYLNDFGIATKEFEFKINKNDWVKSIRSNKKEIYYKIKKLIDIPYIKTDEWYRGYMAGFFDAEGSYSRDLLVSNTNIELLQLFIEGLKKFGFSFEAQSTNKIINLRLKGGLEQIVRFFVLTAPVIKRKAKIIGKSLKKRVKVSKIEAIDTIEMFDLTTDTGNFIANGLVSHNCYEPKEIKIFGIPEIARNDVKIIDMNLLCKHEALSIIKELGAKRVNGKVVSYELVCGIDYRFLTQEIANALYDSRFKRMRIAWDWGYADQFKIKDAIGKLKKAGYKPKDLMIFMICNWKVPMHECWQILMLKRLVENAVKITAEFTHSPEVEKLAQELNIIEEI